MKDPKELAEEKFAEMTKKYSSIYSEENKQLFMFFFMDGYFEGVKTQKENVDAIFEKVF
jgi:hypothetical protein